MSAGLSLYISWGILYNCTRQYWRSIVASVLFSIFIAISFILFAKPVYEVTSVIKGGTLAAAIGSATTSIEDAAELIYRLNQPHVYNQVDEVAGDCLSGMQSNPNLKISALPIKGIASAFELRVLAPSKNLAFECSQDMLNYIKTSQAIKLDPLMERARAELKEGEIRLTYLQHEVSKTDHAIDASISLGNYLSLREEIRSLKSTIFGLKNFISNISSGPASYIVMPYLSKNPEATKKIMLAPLLMIGFCFGVLLGVFQALVRFNLREYNSSIEINI